MTYTHEKLEGASLCPRIKEEMHLQENKLFDLDPKVKLTQNVALFVLCPRVREEMHLQKLHYLTFNLDPQGQGHTTCCSLPSTLCDLCTCNVCSCYMQWFMRRCIYKKIHYSTFDLDLWSHKMLLSTLYIM